MCRSDKSSRMSSSQVCRPPTVHLCTRGPLWLAPGSTSKCGEMGHVTALAEEAQMPILDTHKTGILQN